MTSCANGHPAPEDAAFCAVCGASLTTTQGDGNALDSARGARPLTSEPGPRSGIQTPRSPRAIVIALAAAFILIIGIAIGVNALAADDGTTSQAGTTPIADGAPQPEPQTPAEQCTEVVMGILEQVPNALRLGYSQGVQLTSVSTEYGIQSTEYKTALVGQGNLITKIRLNGAPEEQVESIRPEVEQSCVAGSPKFRRPVPR